MDTEKTLDRLQVSNGVAEVGDPVSAQSKDGYVVEGTVYMLMEWGAEWMDKSWNTGTVVIKDYETKKYSNWNPKNVTVLRRHN